MIRWSALVLGAWLVGASAAAAGTAPEAATLERLRLDGARGVRVLGEFGVKVVHHPLLDSTGVRSADWAAAAAARPALFATADAPHPAVPAPIPWSDIQEIKTNRQHKLRGAVIGGVVGLATALLVVGTDEGDEGGAAGALIGAPIVGALLGTFIGSLTGSKTIYRAQENP